MKTKRIFSIIIAAVLMMSFATAVSADTADTFTDVPDTHPYKVEIDYCKTEGFVLGTSPTTFMPDAALTRGQLATIWCRSRNLGDTNHTFTDVTKLKNYYDTPIIVLNSLGILKGVSDTKYAPNSDITREQLALITMRTYNLGVSNPNDYQIYTDSDSISEGAQDAVSACINAGVFEDLYDGETFQPKKAVTRAEICKLIYNISVPKYDITIDPDITGGDVEASRTSARPGTTITLTVTPDAGMRLTANSLKYDSTVITDRSFTMPAKDITITAAFEAVPVLTSITVDTEPTKTTYTEGQTLNLAGMVVTAHFSDGSEEDVTGDVTTLPDVDDPLATTDTSVTVSYTSGTVTETDSFTITVNPAPTPSP